jgi:predicted Zn-dependent protease with MMP-like domain
MWPIQHADVDDLIEGFVVEALDRLPSEFRDRLGSVAIVIEAEPTADQLGSVGARGLYGLYQGVPRTNYAAETTAYPSKITLFSGPLIRASRTVDQLETRVTDTVYHEIAHHFGISDARIHELQGGHR